MKSAKSKLPGCATRPSSSQAATIRAYLQALPPDETVNVRQVAFDCGVSLNQAQVTLRDMRRRGEVERPAPGQFRHARPEYQPRRAEVKGKILRAIHAAGVFGLREIAILTDANRQYCGEIVRGLVKTDEIERLEKRKNDLNGLWEDRYRVRHPDKFYLRHVLGKATGNRQ